MFQYLHIFSLYFQTLPTKFGIFLKTKLHKELRLCGPSNTITTCKLEFEENDKIVKIGRGWTKFFLKNNIYDNYILKFKCDSIMASNIVVVLIYDETSMHFF